MSQTTCPHCGSTNSIKTAGQTYCADCGQLISSKKDEAQAEPKAKHKEEAKKIQPKNEVVAHKAPRKEAPPINLKVIEAARATKPALAAGGVLDLKNAQPKPAAKPVYKPVQKMPRESEEVAVTPVIAEPSIIAPVESKPVKRFRHKLALRDGLKSVFSARTFGVAFAATVIATICEVIFAKVFVATATNVVTESIKAGSINTIRLQITIDHLGWAGILGFIGYLAYHYALADIIFRTSRAFDRRGAAPAQARRAALGSLAGLFVIDVLTWCFAIISVALVIGANIGFLGTKGLGVYGVILAALTNAIIVYIWLGLIAARHMATYAIVLGQVGVRHAYATGWALYNRQFGRLTSGLMLIGVITGLIALPATAVQSVIGSSQLAVATSAALIALTQAITMVIGAIYFLRLYRYMIAREYDSELGHLLSGRQPRKSHVNRRLAVLGAIAIVWMGLMSVLVLYANQLAHALIR